MIRPRMGQPIVTAIGDNIVSTLSAIGAISLSSGSVTLDVKKETNFTSPTHLLTLVSARECRTQDSDDTYHVKTQEYEVTVWYMPEEGDQTPVDEAKESIWAAVETALMADIKRGGAAQKTTVMGCTRAFDEAGNLVFVVTVEVEFLHPWGQPCAS